MDKYVKTKKKKPEMRSIRHTLIFNGNITIPVHCEKLTYILNKNTHAFNYFVFATIVMSYTILIIRYSNAFSNFVVFKCW